jgi:uncharacterized protein (DUF488 family)
MATNALERLMIFTIGYSNRTLPEFLGELRRREITHIIDVRSSPWSRNTAFNAAQIERWSERAGMLYRQQGAILGGMNYISTDDPRYVDALDAILDAAGRERIVIMCAEGDPAQCHRVWDVGASLLVRYGVIGVNILRNGDNEDMTDTLQRVNPNRLEAPVREALEGMKNTPQVRLF